MRLICARVFHLRPLDRSAHKSYALRDHLFACVLFFSLHLTCARYSFVERRLMFHVKHYGRSRKRTPTCFERRVRTALRQARCATRFKTCANYDKPHGSRPRLLRPIKTIVRRGSFVNDCLLNLLTRSSYACSPKDVCIEQVRFLSNSLFHVKHFIKTSLIFPKRMQQFSYYTLSGEALCGIIYTLAAFSESCNAAKVKIHAGEFHLRQWYNNIFGSFCKKAAMSQK